MPDHFITEFGHKIEFVPGYFEAHQRYMDYVQKTIARTRDPFSTQLVKITGRRPLYSGKQYVSISAMLHFLNHHGLLKRWRRGIDIGGAEGNCIAVLRAAGIVEHAANLDLADFSEVTGPNYFEDYLNFIRTVGTSYDPEAEVARKQIQLTKASFGFFDDEDLLHGLIDPPKKARAQIDEHQHKEFFDAEGTYDLVTTFMGVFEHFDLDKALEKIASMLNPGGLFYCMDGYWWFPINSGGFVGHFPYTTQRLSMPDLRRYLSESHADIMDTVMRRYEYIQGGEHHPTINDWVSLGEKHGLRTLMVERTVPRSHHRTKYPPQRIFSELDVRHSEVLRDIRHLKPDVCVDDLYTSSLKLAMTRA